MNKRNLFGYATLSEYAEKKYGKSITKNPVMPKYEKPKAAPKNKSDFGFYPSPPAVVSQLMDIAKIKSHHSVLEPSAGHGIILDEIKKTSQKFVCGELQLSNCTVLESKGYTVTFNDFLNYTAESFDRIVMNPPFYQQADLHHVLHAYSLLNRGGRLVSVMSNGITFRDNHKTADFRELLKNNGFIKSLPENSFKETGTKVKTVIIVLDKPEAVQE